MFKDTLKKVYQGRWIIAFIVCVFVAAGGYYVIHSNQQTVQASQDARDAARAANASAASASASAASSAHAALRASKASCQAVTQVADTFNPFTAQFKRFLNFFLRDRAQSIARANLAVRNAVTPKQKHAALLAQRQLTKSLARLDALSKAAKQVGPLAC